MLKVLDLFSGLGGFSEGFLERGHKVLRIDNDERFKEVPNTIINNVLEITPECIIEHFSGAPDVVLISTPCNCFSRMTIRYYWSHKRPKNDKARYAVDLVLKTKELVKALKPRFEIWENPVGMMIHILGKPERLTWWAAWYSERDIGIDLNEPPLKETYLWGKLPDMKWPSRPTKYARISRKEKNRQKGVQGIKDSAISAKVPYLFSKALAIACENGDYSLNGYQSTLERRR